MSEKEKFKEKIVKAVNYKIVDLKTNKEAIARVAGVEGRNVRRFLNGETGSMDTIDFMLFLKTLFTYEELSELLKELY